MNWTVIIDGSAEKYLKRIPRQDADRIRKALRELIYKPHTGDVEKMKGNEDIWRRRVGSYRILYEIYESKRLIYVSGIKRRASSTY